MRAVWNLLVSHFTRWGPRSTLQKRPFIFFLSRSWKMPVFISVILYFSIFIDHLHCEIVFLSQVSGRNQCSMFSYPETYTACNHPQQQSLCLILSAEMKKAKRDTKFCSRTWTKLLWIPVLAYQDPLNKFCLLCFNLIQSLSGFLSIEQTLGNVHTGEGNMSLEITT